MDIIKNLSIKPVYNKNDSVNIVFATNNDYCKYLSVLLQSLYKNSDSNRYYDLIIFSSDISKINHNKLLLNLPNNYSLRIFDISNFIKNNVSFLDMKTNNHVTVETYYRLFIPIVMKDYEKVLYLDSDICINYDITELFDIESNKMISATRDTMIGLIHKKNQEYSHIINNLQLQKPYDYVNAGVVLFHINNIDIKSYISKLSNIPQNLDLSYLDQDMLNLIFNSDVNIIDKRWNYEHGRLGIQSLNYLKDVDKVYKNEMLNSYNTPYIVHYTSFFKPWVYPYNKEAQIFWNFARYSPYYDDLIFKLQCNKIVPFMKPDWFKYYEYKIRSLIHSKKQKHYIKKFAKMHLLYKKLCIISNK